MSVKDRGTVTARLSWESGAKTKSEIDTMQLVYQGKYVLLEPLMLPKGAIAASGNDIPAGYKVETSVLQPRKGLLGTLTISLVELDGSDFGIDPLPVDALTRTIETDMAQLERPLLTNPMFTEEASTVAEHIDLWRNGSDVGLRNEYKYKDETGEVDLAGLDLIAAKKIMKGVETWLEFQPVITRTTIWKVRKDPTNIGKINTPPVTVPGTWVYLKVCDRCIQQTDGKYVQTEQWSGAKEWDTDFYT